MTVCTAALEIKVKSAGTRLKEDFGWLSGGLFSFWLILDSRSSYNHTKYDLKKEEIVK